MISSSNRPGGAPHPDSTEAHSADRSRGLGGSSGPEQPQRRKQRHALRTSLIVLLVLVVAAILLRLALPTLVRNQLNERFADMGAYSGYVADVDIALWRGAYALSGVNVTKIDQDVPVPFFAADSIELAISWSALLDRAIVAQVHFHQPSLHFVDGEDEGFQGGGGTDWRDALQELIPIRIDELSISNGEINFHNFHSEPEVHLTLTELQGSFRNITNADRRDEAIPAAFNLQARVFDDARAEVGGSLDPLGNFEDFAVDLRVTGVNLLLMNDLTEAYGNFDFESGQGDLVMELQATSGQLEGYIRPLLNNVAILDLESDLEQGILSATWEAIVGGLGQIFRNQPEDRIAAEIEVSGDITQQEVSTWQAFLSIMRNAFIEVYDTQFRRDSN